MKRGTQGNGWVMRGDLFTSKHVCSTHSSKYIHKGKELLAFNKLICFTHTDRIDPKNLTHAKMLANNKTELENYLTPENYHLL